MATRYTTRNIASDGFLFAYTRLDRRGVLLQLRFDASAKCYVRRTVHSPDCSILRKFSSVSMHYAQNVRATATMTRSLHCALTRTAFGSSKPAGPYRQGTVQIVPAIPSLALQLQSPHLVQYRS